MATFKGKIGGVGLSGLLTKSGTSQQRKKGVKKKSTFSRVDFIPNNTVLVAPDEPQVNFGARDIMTRLVSLPSKGSKGVGDLWYQICIMN